MPFHSEIALVPDSNPNVLASEQTPAGGACAECSVAISPRTPDQIVLAVREQRSTEPAAFARSIVATYYSNDAGSTWHRSADPSLSPAPGQAWGGATDPSVAWDNADNAYLLTLAVTNDFTSIVGIAVYRSTDLGATWQGPVLLHASPADDKPTILVDTSGKQTDGRIYAFWQTPQDFKLRFARSADQGATWYGLGVGPGAGQAGDVIGSTGHFPTFAISPEGHIYVVFETAIAGGSVLRVLRSTDGGDSFTTAADLVRPTDYLMPVSARVQVGADQESANHLPDATFRMDSYPVICAGLNGLVVCAWLDGRYSDPQNGNARVFYMRSVDSGTTWQPQHGSQMSHAGDMSVYHFSPQLALTPRGNIICNYYSYTPTSTTDGLIDVYAQASFDRGATFSEALRVNDQRWNTSMTPMIRLGQADDGKDITFLGDYFGLTAGAIGGAFGEGCISTWTDARRGEEEIYSSRSLLGLVTVYEPDVIIPSLYYRYLGDPVRAILPAIFVVIAFGVFGAGAVLVNAARVPGLLPVSMGLAFGSAVLFALSAYVMERFAADGDAMGGPSQASPSIPLRTLALFRNFIGVGLAASMAALVLLVLPVATMSRGHALRLASYSTLIGAALAAAYGFGNFWFRRRTR